MPNSKLTLLIDGNWLLMSRLSVLQNRYSDDDKLCKDLKLMMIRSINIVLKQFTEIDNIIFVSDGGSWRNKIPVPTFLQEEYKGNRERSDDIDWDLIFGAYHYGLMATCYDITKKNNHKVIAVCPKVYAHDLNKKTPLIIWTKNSKLKYTFTGEVDYYMGMIDVAPTILNMFGLTNDYALGHDIFNIRDNNTVVFPNGNFVTNMLYYNNSTSEYKIINENTIIDENYITERKEYVESLLDVSNAIIVYNLLNEVQGE